MQLPVDWVPATVANADADLQVRAGFFLGIRTVTAYPAGVGFRLVVRVRDENLVDAVDYRAVCGHAVPGYPPAVGGLSLRAQGETADKVRGCQIWPGCQASPWLPMTASWWMPTG